MRDLLSAPAFRGDLAFFTLSCLPGALRTVRFWPGAGNCASLTLYDAAYVALAEAPEATLLTGDQRLARASGPGCAIGIFQPIR